MRPIHALAIVLALLPAAACVQAQPDVSARVDNDSVFVGEVVELTISVSGTGLGRGEPELPPLKDFRLLGQSTQQSVSIINGVMQSSVGYVYQLQPVRAGKLKIGAVHYKGAVTAPITINVSDGGAGMGSGGAGMQPPGGSLLPQNPFGQPAAPTPPIVKQSVSPRRAYVGQQVTYTFSFYLADQLYSQPSYEQAETPGFVAEDLPAPPPSTEVQGSKAYQVQRRRRALFATTPGKHTIGEVAVNVETDPFSGQQRLTAAPVSVTVLPLPAAGQPADFRGAVGSFRAELRLDRPAVRARESLTCTVRITGTGNLHSLGAPALHLPNTVRVFKSGERKTITPGGGGGDSSVMGGTKEFSFLLLPQSEGTLTIPSLDYPYFDPVARAYRLARTRPQTVTVTPGFAAGAAEPALSLGGLRPTRALPGRALHRPVAGQAWFWALLSLPLVLVLWSSWQRWQQLRLLAAPAQARSGAALALARRRLEAAARLPAAGGQDACYAELNATLSDYVADRTGAPPSGLTADAAEELLRQGGASAELAARTRELLVRTAAGRFAPGAAASGGAEQLVADCRDLLGELQRQVNPPRD